jgi:glycosyltransferase involved in cell wall biosynthesis
MAEQLRIAAVVSYFPTSSEPHSGMPIFNLMKALSRMAELKVHVVRSHYPSLRFLHPRNSLHRSYDPNYQVAGVDVRYIGYPALPVVTRPLNGRSCASRLLPHIRASRPDVLLSYIVYPEGNAAVRVGGKLGIPVVVGAVGSDLYRIPDRWIGGLVRDTLRRASFVVTKSRQLREQAIRLGAPADKVQAILNGCDSSLFRYGSREEARRELSVDPAARLAVFTGRLVEVKGLPGLLEAVARVRRDGPPLELALIGDGPLAPALRQLSRRLGIEAGVRLLGARSPAEVARWLAAADVFCLPSYSEGCPNVVLEALSCGRPVVASEVGGIPEIVGGHCGILVPPGDSGALAAALKEALARAWDEEKIAGSYRRDWSVMARETLEICRRVAGRGETAVAGRAMGKVDPVCH